MSLAALLLFFLVLFALPLGLLAKVGLSDAGLPSLGPLAEALQSGSVRRAAWRSFESAAVSGLGALVLGTVLALALGLTDVRSELADGYIAAGRHSGSASRGAAADAEWAPARTLPKTGTA